MPKSGDHATSNQWIDQYHPNTSRELSINPQKLTQVRKSLEGMLSGTTQTRLLILTGPAGSSKSTTVKVLADELVPKYRNASGTYGLSIAQDENCWIEYLDNNSVMGTHQSDQFEEFLNDSKYKVGNNLGVLVIEDLPNIFHEQTLLNFRNAIRQWLHTEDTRLPPLVLCLTEIEYNGGEAKQYSYNVENSLSADTLLGKALLGHPCVENIKFNAIANKFIRKTISEVIRKEREVFRMIPQGTLNSFLDDIVKIGDIRSALFNLQMWKQELLDPSKMLGLSYQRENQVNLFHAIGKVIYSSSEFEKLGDEESDYYSIEKVLSTFNSNNFSLLNLSILENYHIYKDSNYSLQVASNIVNDLSIGDTMSTFEAARDIGIRSTRNHLRKAQPLTPTGGSKSYTQKQKIKFPRQFKMIRQYNKTYKQVRSYQRYIDQRSSFDDLNLIDGYYLPIIYNKKYKKRYTYNRLGGRFLEVYADESLPVVEEGEGEENVVSTSYDLDQFQVDIMKKASGENDADEDYEDGELSDPIDESDEELDSDDGFLSDPELDVLISQGRV
ncbi:uncharacterized protein CANTADRAFT_52541 [Suhomyces tanzawaensis NRRL Y-17324]|uniref:Checkpoint protein RAD24-like helical bundle domain-containing protein n=1 Tax=Suhomyces tanzawaensis NRRL Y-17324 TaxID=984487 RepID=A0A1E4SG47_9ASCO|nr:uncharacterized protein CANTADRAFT_52541 [Suhomyces tanzawaensis NRRL Y-17324]ODV78382.1 hypothetical protein CANTADRAFT_52541 [Suhomyces tanzawaensis NRRL Y-17324]